MTRGARRGLVMLIMGHWEAWGGSQVGPGLKRKSSLSPLGPCGLARGYASVDAIDLVLEVGWANECMALAVQVVSCHCGRLL